MMFRLVLFGSFLILAESEPAADMAQLLRSCDHNADNALNAAEFAGCLERTSGQQRMAARRMGISRPELLRRFIREADQKNAMRADEAELQARTSNLFDSGLLRSGNGDAFGIEAAINKTILLLQYVSEENYTSALSVLYSLISDNEFSASSREFLNKAATALYEENNIQAIGNMFFFIREKAGDADALQTPAVCKSTVINIASLLQVVIVNDSTNVKFYIHRSLAGAIEDFGYFSEQNANALAAVIQTAIEDIDQFHNSLEAFVNNPGVSADVLTALTGLNGTVVNGSSNEISAEILAVLKAAFDNENATEIAQLFSSVTEALMVGNRNEAIEQLTSLLYIVYGSTDSESIFSFDTLLHLTSIISALDEQHNAGALAQINLLISSIKNGLSYSQITALQEVTAVINDGEYDEAITNIVATASSKGRSGVEISVEVFVALSPVVKIMEDNDDANGTISLIEGILSNSSIIVSMEMRSALRALISVVSEDTGGEARAVITAIMAGSSQAFDRNINPQVAVAVQDSLDFLQIRNLNAAIAIVEALLRGERGGSSLSIVLIDDLKMILKALKENTISIPISMLTVISVGLRSNPLPTFATGALISAIHALGVGTSENAVFIVSRIQPLLVDEDLEPSFKAEIQAITNDINDAKYAKALTAVVILLLEPNYSLSDPVSQSLYDALQLTIAGNCTAAIDVVKSVVDDVSADLRLVLKFFIHISRKAMVFGGAILLNVIISEAD